MRTQSRDTSPEAERVLIDLIRKAPITKRFGLVRSMTSALTHANIRDIQRLYPNASLEEITQIFVSGTKQTQRTLAESLKADIEGRQGWTIHETDILVVLNSVAETFEKLLISYYIGGSVTSSVYGMQQLARDIDTVVNLQKEQIRPLAIQLRANYHFDEEMMCKAVEQQTSFSIIHLDTLLKVDVIVPRSCPFELQASHRLQWHILDRDSRPFPLASPEDMVLVKLRLHKVARTIPDDQWNDILGVLKVQRPNLDLAYLEQWATYLGVTDLLKQAYIDAGILEE